LNTSGPAHSFNRRKFIRYGLSSAAALSAVPLTNAFSFERAGAGTDPGTLYKRAIVIDSMMPEIGDVNAGHAVAAGFTACVLDIEAFPRDTKMATEAMERWQKKFAAPGSQFLKIEKGADIRTAKTESKFGIILACQDAAILGAPTFSADDGNLEALKNFYNQGLRVLQITHSSRNALGDSYMEPTNAGLSLLGRAVVESMNHLRMVIDLSHCGDQTTRETLALSARPCVITHAGCKTLFNSGRNKSDEVIRAVADKGGYFGVFNMSVWLTNKEVPTVEDLVDHILYAVKIGGIDHVGFGSDGELEPTRTAAEFLTSFQDYIKRTFGQPGSEVMPHHVVIPELYSIHRLERIAFSLSKRGLSDSDIEKILGGNFARVFGEICG
jgi:membrane dipeptidase